MGFEILPKGKVVKTAETTALKPILRPQDLSPFVDVNKSLFSHFNCDIQGFNDNDYVN